MSRDLYTVSEALEGMRAALIRSLEGIIQTIWDIFGEPHDIR